MSITVKDIIRFDEILADMYRSELTFAILAELALLTVILILALSPRSAWKDTRWGDTSDFYDEKEPRYRNGKKLTRREREAERTKRQKRGNSVIDAVRALSLCALVCVFVGLGISMFIRLDRIQRDMDGDAYAVYEGVFDCDYEGSYVTVTLTFPDGSGNTVSVKGDEHDLDYPEVGKHRGRVVYAKNSGYVLAIESVPKEE